jgi:NADH-quinone oxidoreductase subunit B
MQAVITLQQKIAGQHLERGQRPRWYDPTAPAEYPIPSYGAHDLEPPANDKVWQRPHQCREVTNEEII